MDKVYYVGEMYSDKGGIGTEKVFESEQEAIDWIKKEWDHLTKNERKDQSVAHVYAISYGGDLDEYQENGNLEELKIKEIIDMKDEGKNMYRLLESIGEVNAKNFDQEKMDDPAFLYALSEFADVEPEEIGVFDTLEEARKEKEKYTPDARRMGGAVPVYQITEYYIEEVMWDEDAEEWVATGNYD